MQDLGQVREMLTTLGIPKANDKLSVSAINGMSSSINLKLLIVIKYVNVEHNKRDLARNHNCSAKCSTQGEGEMFTEKYMRIFEVTNNWRVQEMTQKYENLIC